MQVFLDIVRKVANGYLGGAADWVVLSLVLIGGLLVIASVVAAVISLWLMVRYIKFNHCQSSNNMTGKQIARQILDCNHLQDIRVSKNGSILFGNSYSHYFHKVRLRRLTWTKKSVTSMALAAQKSSLAILDQKGDQDMKTRVLLTPFIYFGPLAFLPLILVGVLLDVFMIKSNMGWGTIISAGVGLLIYLISFIMSLLVLKTERKAQRLALEILKRENLATDAEIQMCQELFHLYNIEYVNNMIIALLELIYRVLQIVGMAQDGEFNKHENK